MRLALVTGDHVPKKVDDSLRRGKGIATRAIRERQAVRVSDVTQEPDYVATRARSLSQMAFPLISQDNLVGVLNLESNRHDAFTPERFEFIMLIAARLAVAIDNARLHRQVESQLEEMRQLYNRVSNLEQLKTDMIRIASHDMRNPITSLMGFVELLKADAAALPDSDRLLESIGFIETSARRVQKIAADILSLERIEETASQTHFFPIDLREMIHRAVTDHLPQTRLLQRHLRADLPDGPVWVEADPVQLGEALANLISNALKYTREEGNVVVRLWSEDANAFFEVEDDGYGIREEHQARLFQPFYRARTSDTASIEGTGLGLHLVKNIVERHNGVMRFKSVYGQGSTFGFALPLAVEPGV
jgi:signal transduction histidine kinase